MAFVVDEAIEDYAHRHTRAEPESLQELARLTVEQMECPQMLTGRIEGRLLKLLVTLCRPRLVLELGTFTGYSALSMAEALPPGGKIITCEVNPEAEEVARAAFAASPYGDRIELRMGPALETIHGLDRQIDLAFIDADKVRYPDYYEETLARLRPGGLILIDNVLWSGRVLDPEDDEARAIARLNRTIRDDDRVENVLLTVRDGIQLVRKLD